MPVLEIIWAFDRIIYFKIDSEFYYLYDQSGIWHILDADYKQLNIPNIDNWIESKTHKRYSLRTLQDMGKAFYSGVKTAYDIDEIRALCQKVSLYTIRKIMRSDFVYRYSLQYWIETLEQEDVEKYLKLLRDNFEAIKSKVGELKLYNELCRIFKICQIRQLYGSDICLALINKLGKMVADPKYPNTDTMDKDIIEEVVGLVFQMLSSQRKNMPDSVLDIIEGIRKDKL